MTSRQMQYWVIPPTANGAFVACMANVLETYAQPYDPRFPVVCMDEQPVQWLKETRVPLAATTHHARRVDDEYERAGTASVCMFAEPLQGWRHVRVRRQRTKVDWAVEREALLRTRDAEAHKVLVVCDNLGFDHRIGHFRPLRMATRVLECHIYLRLGYFGLENRLLGWPTPWSRPSGVPPQFRGISQSIFRHVSHGPI